VNPLTGLEELSRVEGALIYSMSGYSGGGVEERSAARAATQTCETERMKRDEVSDNSISPHLTRFRLTPSESRQPDPDRSKEISSLISRTRRVKCWRFVSLALEVRESRQPHDTVRAENQHVI
jgi:hypothetical protein